MKRKLRVLFLTLLAALCAVCLAVAVACDTDPSDLGDQGHNEEPGNTPPEKKTYTVTFNMNGYGVAVAPKSAKEGETVEAPDAPSALFVTFGGWYEDADFTKEFDFTAPLTANVTAYAKWTPTENMPETGYSPDAPKEIVLNGVSISDDIASGTTLYYTFTSVDAGRYGFSMVSGDDVTKFDYACTASASSSEELNENATVVNGDYNFYLTLKAEETVLISVSVKDGETISIETPSDVRISAFVATDEPIPDGMFLEGLYKGNYAGYMTIYFRIKDRTAKIFTMDSEAEGTTENVFTYLDGVLTIPQSNPGDWSLGWGKMTWEAAEEEDDAATIYFEGGNSMMGQYRNFTFVQDIPPINLSHEKWIGEYEAVKDDGEISTVRIGKKYVQVVKKDGTAVCYFTEIGTAFSNYAKFTNTEITCGNAGNIVIKSENDGHADQIRVTLGSKSERLTLKTDKVVEIPYMLPLINGATYTGTVTVDEENEKNYTLTTSSTFWIITGIADDACAIDILDFDGDSTYYTKVTIPTGISSTRTEYYSFKLIQKDGKTAAELYDGDTLIVTLTTDVMGVSANTYALKDGENTGSINADTGYAYITIEENKSYVFTGDVEVYMGVNLLTPDNDSAWTKLPLGEMVNLDESVILAVKPTGEGSSFTFTAEFKPLRGTSEDNPLEIDCSYTFKAQKNVTYFLKFVAPADGEFSFSSSSVSNYVGFCIEGEWYANSEDGSTSLSKNSFKKTLAEGDTLIIKIANNSYKNSSAVSFTLNVAVTYDFSEGTALTLDEDISGKVSETGVYNADITTDGVTALTFNAGETFKIVLSNGTVKSGKSIDLTVAQLSAGFKLICSGEVSYEAVWNPGYAKNPYTLTLGGASASYTWRDVEGNGTHFKFTAPKTETYSFSFAAEGAQKFIYDGNEYEALTLELTEGQTISFCTNKDESVTGTTFKLLVGYNYFDDLTEISFAADNSETALTAGNHKVTAGTLADSTQITFTSQSSFKILYTNGNELESTEADGVHKITVSKSQMAADTVFKLEAESDVNWTVAYALGTVKNPVKLTMNAQTAVTQNSSTITRYATITAPEYFDVNITLGNIPSARGSYYPHFKIVGDESGKKYGYSSYTSASTTYPLVYTVPKGETVILELNYTTFASSWFDKYPVNAYYSFAGDNTTTFDWTAESKTLSASSPKIYKNEDTEVASITFTAEKPFSVYSGASATDTPAKTSARANEDGVYTATVSNKYFFLDYGENTEITYALGTYSVGSVKNPATISALGNTNISYTSVYTDGKYYVTVTVPEAGNYVLGVANGYTLAGEGLTDGVVEFTADDLSKTFTLISDSYTAGGNAITATVAVSVIKKLETETLTFNTAEGSEGEGALELEANNAYIASSVVFEESLDKYIVSILFKSDAAFSIKYPDDTTAAAKAKDGVYTLAVEVKDAQRGFVLTAEGTVTYAIDWLEGSYLNPVEFSSLANKTSVSYDFEKGVYVKVQNDSDYGWLFAVDGEDGCGAEFYEKWTDAGRQPYEGEQTLATLIVIPAGETWILKVFDAPEYDDVQVNITITINFKAIATELAFGNEGETEGKGTTAVSTNSYYVLGETIVSETADADVQNIVFKSESTITVTLSDCSEIEGTEVVIPVAQAKEGFLIVCDGAMTYEVEWYVGSSHNVVVLQLDTQTSVSYRKAHVSYAEFTATEAGWYTFIIGKTGYAFMLGDSEDQITTKREIQLEAGAKVVISITATSATSAIDNVPMTVTYSETQKYVWQEGMIGTWKFNGFVKNSWGWDSTFNGTLTLGDNFAAQYKFGSIDAAIDFVINDDGTYVGTYKQGSNTRTLTIWFEDGVVHFNDSYNAVGDYAMTKVEVSADLFTEDQRGLYVSTYAQEFKVNGVWKTGYVGVEINATATITYQVVDAKDDSIVYVDEQVKLSANGDQFTGTYGDEGQLTIKFVAGQLIITDPVYTSGGPCDTEKQVV